MESLLKFLSRESAFSRRHSEELIREGRVKVNKEKVTSPTFSVSPQDIITVDDKVVRQGTIFVYIALYKPAGYLSDLKDPRGRKMARDLIKHDLKLFPVGRLDYSSEGLMIFTNDGETANYIMHPRYGVTKEYLVKFKGIPSRETIKKMKKGITIDGELYRADDVRPFKISVSNAWFKVTVNEGKNRMIRKMGEAAGHPVLKLKRVRIGKLLLGDLNPGEYRHVEKNEII
ncbi:MAG TPA: pseudouridine synthase [Syntrophorhabdaceae bacterium]|nr:pseudouridine synthase [Syntrophorhabdaceae bacterium]